ncbi:hypothetical protein DPMN_075833 [Dreissena polymorpha]|uniref:Uncharacterized protein n=1 Tax=Dreissena polymorpha TaxID=45954 RepID=A0A9D3YHK2_DREPO|nr:hypothetical protein DPMN_075833 [Dreissena polymorpha]
MLMPRIMKLHRYIDHDWQMTPIDFHVIRSKVTVTVPKNVSTQWLPLQLTAHMGGMHVLQTALVNFGVVFYFEWKLEYPEETPLARYGDHQPNVHASGNVD